ncbi:uncharacterized protein SPSK_05627 [Sporothrix schenckii 1099-18]|uniref:Uncharacterized protein n=1 Tax=Sporothrix schenckii 1099-18 TaxID=1397361 RepID=A0A0F2LWE6_SPOSC|nr:uncharacterized protein SPSK_05627 [Sporothrix schenckii 1099-18]KJR81154.1 hypothetical protein SPSK_05627 [Sporothrix schenckii 1099-18]
MQVEARLRRPWPNQRNVLVGVAVRKQCRHPGTQQTGDAVGWLESNGRGKRQDDSEARPRLQCVRSDVSEIDADLGEGKDKNRSVDSGRPTAAHGRDDTWDMLVSAGRSVENKGRKAMVLDAVLAAVLAEGRLDSFKVAHEEGAA